MRVKTNKSKAEKHKRHSTVAIAFTGIVFSVLFGFMCFYMVNYSFTHQIEMFDNSYNSYQTIISEEISRGSIYSANNELLAYTDTEGDADERVYPYANMYSHFVGYSSHGRMGVESIGNYYLLNSHSGLSDRIDAGANEQKIPGDNIYTTVDTRLQEVAYNSLGVYQGAIIVTEVKTGRVLAMVSKPDFDPNRIDYTWEEMLNDTEDSRLLNRVTQGLYPPGSTFKIITALEYIRENPENYNSYHFNCGGSFSYESTKIKCYHGSVHGSLDFATSFAKSCNSSFANMSTTLDRRNFSNTLTELMFGEPLPVDFPTSISTVAIDENVDSHNLMQGSIGQGQDAITPLHLNLITCAIANDGTFMIPYFIDEVKSSTGASIKKFNPTKGKTILTSEESEILTDLMVGVVQFGTGTKLKGLSYTAAGKTGSAEFNSNRDDSHAWFTGFAPAEEPEIALTIIIENAGSGGEYAVPIAKRIFDAYFD